MGVNTQSVAAVAARQAFLGKAQAAAVAAGHVWPAYAACEMALESAWGQSQLCRKYNNLFGQKQGTKVALPYPAVVLGTQEFLPSGQVAAEQAAFLVFPDWATACRERMALLHRLPRYAPALAAADGPGFVRQVSAAWSTDPQRADHVLQIYQRHQSYLEGLLA